MHEKGICHRDLWPTNILCSSDGVNLKIIDFGVARRIPDKSNDQNKWMYTNTGCMSYRAPELIRG